MFGSVCLGAGSNCKLRKSLEIRGLYLQRILHEFIDFHNSCLVTTAVAVVRSREDSNHIPFMRPIVSIHHQLMSSWYQFQIVCMVKLFRDILSERIAGTSWGDTPTASIIRVWPQEIANRSMINSLRGVPISLTYPSWGTSWTLSSCLIWSRVSIDGERPPWRQKIWPSTTAVNGR